VPRSFVSEARRRVGPKKLRIMPVIERLAIEHADATIALTFANELELLVSVMLSAQTTDVNVNRVTATLFQKYRQPEDYLEVPQEELERDIFATGFYRQKAKSLRGTMRMLLEEFDGEVPASRARRRTSLRQSSGTRRVSSSIHTSGASPNDSASRRRKIRSRSSATS
jgi:endonuclease-3